MKEISPLILKVVEKMRESFGWMTIDILDTEMSQKYPNQFAPNGYWGVTIEVDSGIKKYKTFLKYQECEDFVFIGLDNFVENYIFNLTRDDIPALLKKFERLERRKKLEKLCQI